MVDDVEKPFHQIEISSGNRKMLRFLWFDNIYKVHPDIAEYQFNFVDLYLGWRQTHYNFNIYIQRNFDLYEAKESEVVSLLRELFYVDDFMGGAFDDDQAFAIHEKASDNLKDENYENVIPTQNMFKRSYANLKNRLWITYISNGRPLAREQYVGEAIAYC